MNVGVDPLNQTGSVTVAGCNLIMALCHYMARADFCDAVDATVLTCAFGL